MRQNQIEKTWHKHLVDKLQDRYGLSLEQARFRANLWLQWIKEPPFLSSDSDAPKDRLASSRPPHSRSSESKSAKAKRLCPPQPRYGNLCRLANSNHPQSAPVPSLSSHVFSKDITQRDAAGGPWVLQSPNLIRISRVIVTRHGHRRDPQTL